MTVTAIEPPLELMTPRGKADAFWLIDYSQESYVYFVTAQRGTGDWWVYRNDKVQLAWNESTGLGAKLLEEDKFEKHGPDESGGNCNLSVRDLSVRYT